MEKRVKCEKHSIEFTFYCKKCKRVICVACVEEHNDQGHACMLLSKYASQFIIPEMVGKITALQSKDEAKTLHNELALYLSQTSVQESKHQLIRGEAVRCLNADRDGASESLAQLKSLLLSAVSGNNTKEIINLLAEYNTLNESICISDAQVNQIKALVAKYKTIMQGWAAEDAFYAELQDYIKKLHATKETVPFIHTFKATQWDTLVLYNLNTQQEVKQHLDLPVGNKYNISSAQVKNTVYLSGGYVNYTCLAATYKVIVDSKLGIQQQKVASMNIPKCYHALVAHDDRVLLSLGGWNGSQILNCCECYTIAKDAWEEWKPLTCPREIPYACSVYPQYVYCFGGCGAQFDTWLEKIDMQSPKNGWVVSAVSVKAPFVPNSSFGLAIQLDADSILLFGNANGSSASSCIYRMSKNTCEQYQTEGIREQIFVHSYPIKYNGKVYAFGQRNQGLHEYTIATNTWKFTALPA